VDCYKISYPIMRFRCLLLSVLCLSTAGWGQAYYGVEPAPLKSTAPFAETLRNFLDPQGMQLVASPDGQKTTICEVWWAKSVSAFAKPHGPQDASYSTLEPGALVGVVHYPAEFLDASGQKLRAGYYTMRYVLLPRDKAHQRVIAYPDFVALSPAALDHKSRKTLPLSDLLLLSRQASRKRHPAVISLVPFNPGYEDLPMVVPDESGQAILQVKIRTRTGEAAPEDLKMAIELVPTPKHDIGS
jgi:hypothetical protein